MASRASTGAPFTEAHDAVVAALRARDYERLVIKRSGDKCYLVVVRAGDAHVFLDRQGNPLVRRHAWQIREWLHRDIGIQPEDVAVG